MMEEGLNVRVSILVCLFFAVGACTSLCMYLCSNVHPCVCVNVWEKDSHDLGWKRPGLNLPSLRLF